VQFPRPGFFRRQLIAIGASMSIALTSQFAVALTCVEHEPAPQLQIRKGETKAAFLARLGESKKAKAGEFVRTHLEGADLVFVGFLERVEEERIAEWHKVRLGRFLVAKDYIGGLQRQVTVWVNADTQPKKQYLVFARTKKPNFLDTPVNDASGPCEQTIYAIDKLENGELAMLEQTKIAGAGGTLNLQVLWKHADQAGDSVLPAKDFPLEFSGQPGFSIRTNHRGEASVAKLMAGEYRLKTPPPRGYKFVIGEPLTDQRKGILKVRDWHESELQILIVGQ
jgi:hypothetical protein